MEVEHDEQYIAIGFITGKYKLQYNLCNPFKHDHRCASLSGVEFVFTKERREKEGAAEVMFERVTKIIVRISNTFKSFPFHPISSF